MGVKIKAVSTEGVADVPAAGAAQQGPGGGLVAEALAAAEKSKPAKWISLEVVDEIKVGDIVSLENI
eukprot:5762749-Karenia_brevis.AAC.1